ncbi:unnamed protein product [Brachionus calyciflorus]|uniref:Uncharacterized protein n=1 Tax=Brachionus calyciflorus TaxID=104777 RepID=A0A814PP10_9BILA|nr:unnamed protein product [Brachionus calyciflorus]
MDDFDENGNRINRFDNLCASAANNSFGDKVLSPVEFLLGFLLPAYWPEERRKVVSFLIFLSIIGVVIVLALIPLYLPKSSTTNTIIRPAGDPGYTLYFSDVCFIPINGSLLNISLQNDQTNAISSTYSEEIRLVLHDFFSQIFNSSTSNVNVTILKYKLRNQERIVRPEIIVTFKYNISMDVFINQIRSLTPQKIYNVLTGINKTFSNESIEKSCSETENVLNASLCDGKKCQNIICTINDDGCKDKDLSLVVITTRVSTRAPTTKITSTAITSSSTNPQTDKPNTDDKSKKNKKKN